MLGSNPSNKPALAMLSIRKFMDIHIEKVKVSFPFEPYPQQVELMTTLITAMQQVCCFKKSENGLVESPTGTGKTLCLLLSSLSWRNSYIDWSKNRTDSRLFRAAFGPNATFDVNRAYSSFR
jgi:hypothetical protein